MSMLRIRKGVGRWRGVRVISSWRRDLRTGFVPEVEMPHWKANSFNWESLRVVGRVSAIHCRFEEGRNGGGWW
jgi:hypothetical protein